MREMFASMKIGLLTVTLQLLVALLFFPVIANATFLYDDVGNIIQDDQFHYTYNDAGRVSVVRRGSQSGEIIAQYFYNHEGQRIKKVENGNTCYYINKSYQSCDDGDTIFYFVENERIAHKKNGVKEYYHNNHLGSPVAKTTQQILPIQHLDYAPYGKTIDSGQYLFTGKERDSTDNYYFEARYYNPDLRQFQQVDPVTPAVGDSFSLNPYTYTRNNPLKYIDPDGRRTILSFNQQATFSLIGSLNVLQRTTYIISPEVVIDSAKAEYSSSGNVANSIKAGANASGFLVKKQFHTVSVGAEAGAEVNGKYSVGVLKNLPADGESTVYGEVGGEVGAGGKAGLKLRVESQNYTSEIENFSVKADALIFNAELGSQGYEMGIGGGAGGSIGGVGRETTYETTGMNSSQAAEYIRSRRNN